MESGKMTLEPHEVDIWHCLELTLKTYEPLALQKGVALKLNIDPAIPKQMRFDDTRLSQVIGNLVSNAIKFTDEGYVAVKVEKRQPLENRMIVRFSIEDTGEGIAPHHLEEIFETFAQPRSVATRKQGGTGLGLAIVKHIIQLFESEVHVNSTLGHGTTFHFDVCMEPIAYTEDPGLNHQEKLRGMKVLLAEDNTINAIVAKQLLTGWGMEVDHVENGHEAVSKASESKYDFILMDIHMPDMSGFEATQQVRSSKGKNATTTIFALTADITIDKDDDFYTWFDGYLTKPIDIEKMKAELTAGCW